MSGITDLHVPRRGASGLSGASCGAIVIGGTSRDNGDVDIVERLEGLRWSELGTLHRPTTCASCIQVS